LFVGFVFIGVCIGVLALLLFGFLNGFCVDVFWVVLLCFVFLVCEAVIEVVIVGDGAFGVGFKVFV